MTEDTNDIVNRITDTFSGPYTLKTEETRYPKEYATLKQAHEDASYNLPLV